MNYKVIANRPGRVTYKVTEHDVGEGRSHNYSWLADQLDPNNFGYYVHVDSDEYILIDIYTD
jgi:hypothetical protein